MTVKNLCFFLFPSFSLSMCREIVASNIGEEGKSRIRKGEKSQCALSHLYKRMWEGRQTNTIQEGTIKSCTLMCHGNRLPMILVPSLTMRMHALILAGEPSCLTLGSGRAVLPP